MRVSYSGNRTPPRPFPVAALLACLSGQSNREMAVELDVAQRQITRYKAQGTLSIDQADVLANRAGYHPAEIWGDLWWQQAEQEAS